MPVLTAVGRWCLSVVAAGLIWAACSPPPMRPGWGPQSDPASVLAPAADPLVQVDNLLAEALVTVFQGRGRQSAVAALRWCGPDLARLDVRGPLAAPLLSALVEADSVTIWGPAANGAWRGAARGPLLARLTGVDLAGYDLARALLGVVQPIGPGEVATSASGPDGLTEVTLAGVGPVRRVWVDRRSGLVVRESLTADGSEVLFERRLGQYQAVGALLLPRRVEIRHGPDMRLVVTIRRLLVGSVMDSARLRRDLPVTGVRYLGPDDTVPLPGGPMR